VKAHRRIFDNSLALRCERFFTHKQKNQLHFKRALFSFSNMLHGRMFFGYLFLIVEREMKKLLLSVFLIFVFGVSSAYANAGDEDSFSSRSGGHHGGGHHGGGHHGGGHHGGGHHGGGDGQPGGGDNTPPVPEPEEWAMLIVGLGLIGMRLSRKTDNEKSIALIG
jgi:hypothetical protein